MIGDPHIIDAAVKFKTGHARAPSDGHIRRRVLLGRSNRPLQCAIIQCAVEVDIEGLIDGVVDARDVIPGVEL